jgi:predicted transcriptional regulator
MPRRKAKTFTEVELEFMQVIWAAKEVSTEDVQVALQKQGRDLSDGSVRKVLSILVQKGHLTRRRQGRGFLYAPRVLEDKANQRMVRDLVKRAFGGSASLMIAALFDDRAVSKRDIAEIKRLIAEAEKEAES